jgi:hypothetical protein
MRFTPAEINKLRAAYAGIKKCTTEHFAKMKTSLRKLDNEALRQIQESGVPFVDTAANSLLCDRGELPEDARLDWAADKIASKMRAAAVA